MFEAKEDLSYQSSKMSVVAALADLKKYSQKKKPANISNWVFRMHKYVLFRLLEIKGAPRPKLLDCVSHTQ